MREFTRLARKRRHIITPTDGKETLQLAADAGLFSLSPSYREYECDVPVDVVTPYTEVEEHEQIKDGKFPELYGDIGRPLQQLCLEQSQINRFTTDFLEEFKFPLTNAFFLMKVGEVVLPDASNLFVAHAHLFPIVHTEPENKSMRIHFYQFNCGELWHLIREFRLVVPVVEE